MSKRYGVVIEGDESGLGFSAYAPDLPGCIGAGATVKETAREMRSAITAHIEWLLRDGDPVPDPKDVVPVDIPHASVTFIEVDVPAPAKTLKA